MADVQQVETFSAKLFPFDRYKDLVGVTAAVPWGQAVIDSAFEANAIAAGNTGTLALDINLPPNYCCLLRSLHLSAYDVSTISWLSGLFGMAYQLPGGPYKNSMAALPEKDFLWWPLPTTDHAVVRNRSGTAYRSKSWSVSEKESSTDSGSSGSPGSDNPMNIPMWISPNYPGSNIVIYIECDVASTPAIDFRLNAVFDIYDQQQAFAPEVMASPRRLAT
jgi:hypothetical protein